APQARNLPAGPVAGRDEAKKDVVWSPAWGDLPAQGFVEAGEPLTQNSTQPPALMAQEPASNQALGGLGAANADSGARGFGGGRAAGGEGRLGGGFGGGGADQPAPRSKQAAVAPGAPAGAVAERSAEATAPWISVANGEVLLVRSADGQRYTAVQPVRQST